MFCLVFNSRRLNRFNTGWSILEQLDNTDPKVKYKVIYNNPTLSNLNGDKRINVPKEMVSYELSSLIQ